MQFSYSRVELFENCPYRYKLSYVDKLKAIQSDDPANALLLGTAMHTGIEKGVDAAIDEYLMSYPIITDEHYDEAMKLEYLIPKVKEMLPTSGKFEVELSNDDFHGFIDYLVPNPLTMKYDLYDFKYSNNTASYRNSGQLHLYKYYFELLNPGEEIDQMFYVMIPKVKFKRGKTESLESYRMRIQAELEKSEPFLVPIKFDYRKVGMYLTEIKSIFETTDYPKSKSYLCGYCEFQNYCEKGENYMLLPKNERRNIEKVSKRTIWLYGSPFCGKTTFANKFPDPLMLNTDGNITFVDAPFIAIKNDVRVDGRQTKTTLAWEVFKQAIDELEKKNNDFKTIIVDLVEDLYEHCRLYMYQQMGITHESDDSFRAWDKVRTEFLSTLKRLMNLDYENIILISHEDTSKDITRKGGDKITAIKPNLQEKASNKVAGMVHIVARVVADGDIRTLSFKQNEVIFGGGRLTVQKQEIPLDYDEFLKIFDEASKNAASAMTGKQKKSTSPAKKEQKPTENAGSEESTDEAVYNEGVAGESTNTPPDASQSKTEETQIENEGEDIPPDNPPVESDSDAPDAVQPKEPKKAENPPTVRSRKRRDE